MKSSDGAPEYSALPPEFSLPAAGSGPHDPYLTTAREETKEYQYTTSKEDSVHKSKSKKMRALLIQAAGVLVAGVTVLSSFGIDFLGSDGLFSTPTASPSTPSSSSGPVSPTPPSAYSIDPMPSVASKWPTKTIISYHLTYLPDGTVFEPTVTDEEGLAAIKSKVIALGGDPDEMKLVKAENKKLGLRASEDAIIVGSVDSPESIYLAAGELWWEFTRDEYYEADASLVPVVGETYDDAFPTLINLDPDFEGKYAWSTAGSEEYIRFFRTGDSAYSYLQKGSAWDVYDASGQVVTDPEISYNAKTNTLTLTDFTAEYLDLNLMGNGLKIVVNGDNHVGFISIWGASYGGSATFTGTGTLTVNEEKQFDAGIALLAEYSPSCLMIDRQVTLDVYGTTFAILVDDSTMEKSIYYLSPIVMTGGIRTIGNLSGNAKMYIDDYGNYIDTAELSLEELQELYGEVFYDSTIVDENGERSLHVKFTPAE